MIDNSSNYYCYEKLKPHWYNKQNKNIIEGTKNYLPLIPYE